MQIPPPVMTAADLDAFLAEHYPDAGRAYRAVEVTGSGVVMRLPVGPEHQRPGGTVSGPTLMGLADVAAWLATLSRVGPVPLAVTSSLTMHFLGKPPLDDDLLADAGLLRLGARSSVTEVRIATATGGDLVASATVAYAIPS